MKILFSVLVAGLLLANPATAAGPSAPTPQIWFSMGALTSPAGHQSWDTLFYNPDAPWPEFMNHLHVVGILTQALLKISDEDLAKVVVRLKQKHVALGIEMLAQAYTLPGIDAPPHCGEGVEGHYAPFATAALAAKLKRAGATLDYIAMDEPLWFGHYYNGKLACHSSIENVAERVAANLREYQKVFPHVIIGDGEPFPSITDQPHWQDDYKEWLRFFQVKTGQPLAYTFVDINWGVTHWPASLQAMRDFAHQVHLPLGTIYNDAPPRAAMSNQDWLDDAVRNFTHIERTLRVSPDWLAFSSWEKYPGHALTDSYGVGEDYLVKQYLQLHGVK
ncbi:hypothetical protein [Bradyrhizobium sp.]|uniref:hypothetical protein n=1 Tax=Bradyrhizobium sp. TaxID=376 RepID=UPI001EB4A24E|nr:hypothetical protein [Bradyrhizobium sp.]MBV8919849.1 hypothetical protein [Bradyrhizobium sp.]MBV9980895.1 hypothetical protein [Bradyrhizobium sp.]